MAFLTELGFVFNADYSDVNAACMVVDENIFVMLLTEDRFKDFINDEIADAWSTTETINCLSVDSKEELDATIAKAIAAGGKSWKPAMNEGPDARRELPGPRRSRLGAPLHGAVDGC